MQRFSPIKKLITSRDRPELDRYWLSSTGANGKKSLFTCIFSSRHIVYRDKDTREVCNGKMLAQMMQGITNGMTEELSGKD
jgi:hypothetical protein